MSVRRRSVAGTPPSVTWRRRLIAVAVLLAAVVGATQLGNRVVSGAAPPPVPRPASRVLEIATGQRELVRVKLRADRPVDEGRLRRLLTTRLPRQVVASRGRARITYRYDLEATLRRAVALGARGGRVQAVRERVSSKILAPVVAQFQRNTCEAAALEVLLASAGVRVSQQRLQAAFPRSGPLDPEGSGSTRSWGDPDLGYVGRPDGGGVAGGFGVYPGPVAQTARKYGGRFEDLTASSPERIYARVLAGRAVMAWIGLSDGPYDSWRSPQGKKIDVNYGEHTIVLTGMSGDGELRVVNPLEGTLETWSRSRFEAAWQLLGRRALGA